MDDLIEEWKNANKSDKKAQVKLVKRLTDKKNKNIDEVANKAHQEVFSKLDCLNCANCCTNIPPMLVRSDIKRIAKHLRLKEAQFTEQYLTMDNDGDMVMRTSPCVFLGHDNKCDIYEVRPKACRQYPHTDAYEFRNNSNLHAINSRYCPAVYHILKRLESII